MIVYINGQFMDESAAGIGITDRGLTLGDGVFDTMLAIDGACIDIDMHYERLARHAAKIAISIDTAPLRATAQDILRQNDFISGRHAIRTTVTRGPASHGLAPSAATMPTIIIRATPVPPASSAAPRLIVAQSVRRNERSPLSCIKSLNYGDNIIAATEARNAGADDALLLNNAGNAACASAANIYVLAGDEWLTPYLADGAMDGITRAHLLATGRVREATIGCDMLRTCSAIALSSSIAGLRGAATLDERALDTARLP